MIASLIQEVTETSTDRVMNAEQKDEFLKDEYLLLQGFYEDYDRRTLLIKGWSVTVAIAGLALGFEKELPAIWILSGIAAALFWLIDGKWRTYQYANRKRIKEIEAYFRNKIGKDIVPLQTYNSWLSGYEEQSLSRILLYPLVMLPPAVAILICLCLLIVHYTIYNLFTQT